MACKDAPPEQETGVVVESDTDVDTDTDADTDADADTDVVLLTDARDDAFRAAMGVPEIFGVLYNDVGTGPLWVASVTEPDHGTASVTSDSQVEYVSPPDFVGTDSFSYTLIDGNGDSATATVQVEVGHRVSDDLAFYGMTPLMRTTNGWLFAGHQEDPLDGVGVFIKTSPDGLSWGPHDFVLPHETLEGPPTHASLTHWENASGQQVTGLTFRRVEATGYESWWIMNRAGTGPWSTPVRVSNHGDATTTHHALVSVGDGELLFLSTVGSGFGARIRRRRSTDGGLSWVSETTFGEAGYHGTITSAVADGDTVYVLTSADRSFKRTVELYVSHDRGVTYGDAVDITGFAFPQFQNHFADFGTLRVGAFGTLHVVYEVVTPDDPMTRIVHRSSIDQGTTWSDPVQVSDLVHTIPLDDDPHRKPRLEIGGEGRLHVAWADSREGNVPEAIDDRNFDVYYSMSSDGGSTWTSDLRVNDMPVLRRQDRFAIAVEPGPVQDVVHMVYSDDRNDTDGVEPRFYQLRFVTF